MTIFVFTPRPSSMPAAQTRRSKSGLSIEVHPLEELRKTLPGLAEGSIVYVDVHGQDDKARARLVSVLSRSRNVYYGVIDSMGSVPDVAALFHGGAVDYLGKKLGAKGLTPKRLSTVLSYIRDTHQAEEVTETECPPESAVDGWADIQSGKAYPFAILFVEVDGTEEMKKRFEAGNLTSAMATFRAFIERTVAQHGGRTWIWSRFGGLALFPLTNGTCRAAPCCLRLLLSRLLFDVEESPLPGCLSFRMALSIGTTVYSESNTGKIISDSLNSIFHLGQKCARPGQFLITAEALARAPQPLRGYFVPSGTFEGKRIFRMLSLQLPGGTEGER